MTTQDDERRQRAEAMEATTRNLTQAAEAMERLVNQLGGPANPPETPAQAPTNQPAANNP